MSHLGELTKEEQDAVSEFLERLNKKINKDAPEGAKSSQDEFLSEAIDVKDFAQISEKYSEELINQIINEMGEQGELVLTALGKLDNVDVLFDDEFELSPDEFPEDEETEIASKPEEIEQERSSDEDKKEIELSTLTEITTFLWNKTGDERIKYVKEIAEALNKFLRS